MRTVNSVILLGNIVKDPELKVTLSGKEFSTFTLATNKEVMKSPGQFSSVSEFHSVVAWGNLARIASSFCGKGKLVYVEGYLKTRTWEGEAGKKMYRTEIIATNIISLSSDTSVPPPSPSVLSSPLAGEDDESFFNASEEDFFATDHR